LEELADEHPVLVRGPARLGLQTPMIHEALTLVDAQDRVRVSDVDDQQHAGATVALNPVPRSGDFFIDSPWPHGPETAPPIRQGPFAPGRSPSIRQGP